MKRVFLSFLAEDADKVNGLRLLAANPRHDIEFFDESVRVPYDSYNASYIKQNIREKIGRASVTVCLASAQTWMSPWVDWELEESYAAGNKVICMGFKDGPTQIKLPAPIVKRENWIWWWNPDKLFSLIDV